jgi:hypothetical protein
MKGVAGTDGEGDTSRCLGLITSMYFLPQDLMWKSVSLCAFLRLVYTYMH